MERNKEFAEEDKMISAVPEWQSELGIKELEKIANGTADLMGWEEARNAIFGTFFGYRF
jgi:hypothetical protein